MKGAALKPEVAQLELVERLHQAERIIDVGRLVRPSPRFMVFYLAD